MGYVIETVSKYVYLGVIIDENLNFTAHIINVCYVGANKIDLNRLQNFKIRL